MRIILGIKDLISDLWEFYIDGFKNECKKWWHYPLWALIPVWGPFLLIGLLSWIFFVEILFKRRVFKVGDLVVDRDGQLCIILKRFFIDPNEYSNRFLIHRVYRLEAMCEDDVDILALDRIKVNKDVQGEEKNVAQEVSNL